MVGYLKPNRNQRTNWRNRHAIVELLARGETVDILALADSGLLRYGAFHLNLAAGLEDSIIRVLKPEWNGGRSSSALETLAEADPPEGAPASQPTALDEELDSAPALMAVSGTAAPVPMAGLAAATHEAMKPKSRLAAAHFTLTLQETYHRTGFFNVPIGYDRYFGEDAQQITIYCGPEELAVTGRINRTANTNGTPRIMGAVPLREWFQKRKVMSRLKVSIVTPTTIRIHDQ